MFETKKDYNKTEMRTLIELLYSSIAIKALSSKIWAVSLVSLSALVPLISLSLVVQHTKVTRAMKKTLLLLLSYPICMFSGYVVLIGCAYAFFIVGL